MAIVGQASRAAIGGSYQQETEIAKAAEVVNSAGRVAILIGQGARGAAAEVPRLAEVTGDGVAKALLGKDVLPDDLPYVTGAIGLLGTRPSYELMRDCDALVMIGSSFPYTQFMPEFGKKAIEIDIDAHMIGMRYPTQANLVGDAKETLRALLPVGDSCPTCRTRQSPRISGWGARDR